MPFSIPLMHPYLQIINGFIEDTCVLIAVAYILARGRSLMLLFQKPLSPANTLFLGGVLGGIGLTEIFFPGARFPYVTDILIIALAGVVSGLSVALIAATVVSAGVFLLQHPNDALITMVCAVSSAFLSDSIRRFFSDRHPIFSDRHPIFSDRHPIFSDRHPIARGMIAAGLTQGFCVLVAGLYGAAVKHPLDLINAGISIAANSFGISLLLLIFNDAWARFSSEKHRIEAERSQALLAKSQLTALRARVHPHFLFNTLSSIAGLCILAPEKAADAIVNLGELMRRSLEASATTQISLTTELEQTRLYLEIEEQRFGPHLQICWPVALLAETALVPPFAVQILVENAINHGLAPQMEPGKLTIHVRTFRKNVLIAVQDNGVGMDAETRQRILSGENALHGLPILSEQLVLLYGDKARLRIFSQPDRGTLVVFCVSMRKSRE